MASTSLRHLRINPSVLAVAVAAFGTPAWTQAVPQGLPAAVSPADSDASQADAPNPATVTESQRSGEDDIAEVEAVVVTGFRQSLQSAQNRKRNAGEIVDSIVAEDIGKLGDTNVVETLQRVPGVQITRDHGVGQSIQIRGLSQTNTLVNGRNVPGLSLGDTPSEIVAGVDVYKNPSAELIEGGLGGTVDLRTRRPFDFAESTASFTLRADYYDLIEEARPIVSALLSKRFSTGMGEIGVLVNAAYIGISGRQDQIGAEPFNLRYDIVDFDRDGFFPGTNADPGDGVLVPVGGGGSVEASDRTRIIATGAVQWRPSQAFELLVEGFYVESDYKLSTVSPFANRGALRPAPGVEFVFAPGTNVVQAGAFRDVSFAKNSSTSDSLAEFYQLGGTARWDPTESLRIVGDISYSTDSDTLQSNSLRIGNANPAVNGPILRFDTRTEVPTFLLSGAPTQSTEYFYYNSQNAREINENTNRAAQLEADYDVGGLIDSVELGVRYERLTADRQRGMRNRIPSGSRPIALLPQGFQPDPFSDFFQGTDLFNLNGLPVAPVSLTRDIAAQCAAFGDLICTEVFSPIDTYAQVRTSHALYGQANLEFDVGPLPVVGNVGARLLRTNEEVEGFRISLTGAAVPLAQETEYENLLPSINLRAELRENLFLRVAAAKQLTRPALSQLAPNLTLSVQTAIGLRGTAGNPELEPLESTSLDASLEYYFSADGYAYFSAFQKDVTGFIQTVTSTEPVNLPDYPGFTTAEITRPQNGGDGTIKGFEVGVQTFLSFLPSPFDGLGFQANYTYVDSQAPGPIAGTTVPLTGLSQNSINLIGYYEKDRFRARLAYNWRDDYVQTTSGPGSGSLPIYAKPIAFLDGSIGYSFSDNVEVTFDATNLLRAKAESYFGEEIRPRFDNIYDRRFGVSLRVRR